jgi:hypothetical protein
MPELSMPDDLSPARAHLLQAFRHAPPPGASDAMLTETLGRPRTLDSVLWAASLLSQLRLALTTIAQWQQWGACAMELMQDLVQAYEPPQDDA